VVRNRSFLTAAVATLVFFFGQMGMMLSPIFLQGIQRISAMRSGQIYTPCSVLMASIGAPVGFLLVRTERYKWMSLLGFGLLTVDMHEDVFLAAESPVVWSVLAALPGIGRHPDCEHDGRPECRSREIARGGDGRGPFPGPSWLSHECHVCPGTRSFIAQWIEIGGGSCDYDPLRQSSSASIATG
jgi:hypothetical protein